MANNPSSGYLLLMCSKNWPHILYWNGSAASASPISQSPANVFAMANYQNCVVAAIDQTNSISFSDPGDPMKWPSDSQLDIDTKWGVITGLVSTDDKIVIFCEKGILYLSGDLLDQPYVGILHPEIGATRGLITQYGSSIMFVYGQNLYTLDGSVTLVSDSIRDQLDIPLNSHLTMNDEYAIIRPGRGQGELSDLYTYEKLRFGFWSHHTFPSNTGIGGLNPIQGIVKYVAYPWDCFLIPGGNGNVYAQPLLDKGSIVGSSDIEYYSTNSTPTLSRVETRLLDFGDRLLTKQFRRGMIYGEGHDITVTLAFVSKDKVITEVTPELSSTTLPCQFTVPIADGTENSPPTEFQEMSLYIEGKNILLQKMTIDFKPIRYNLLTF